MSFFSKYKITLIIFLDLSKTFFFQLNLGQSSRKLSLHLTLLLIIIAYLLLSIWSDHESGPLCHKKSYGWFKNCELHNIELTCIFDLTVNAYSLTRALRFKQPCIREFQKNCMGIWRLGGQWVFRLMSY